MSRVERKRWAPKTKPTPTNERKSSVFLLAPAVPDEPPRPDAHRRASAAPRTDADPPPRLAPTRILLASSTWTPRQHGSTMQAPPAGSPSRAAAPQRGSVVGPPRPVADMPGNAGRGLASMLSSAGHRAPTQILGPTTTPCRRLRLGERRRNFAFPLSLYAKCLLRLRRLLEAASDMQKKTMHELFCILPSLLETVLHLSHCGTR